jgi:Zn-dependent peptidase ImmA (M78 family)/DNA-binding XRE family transcriptional regulator
MSDEPANREMLVLARQARCLTQTELAEKLGISQAQVSKIENGLDRADPALVARYAQVLDYRPSFFFQTNSLVGLPPYHHRKRARLGAKKLDAIYAELNIRRLHLQTLVRSAELDTPKALPDLRLEDFENDSAEAARVLREHWLLPRGPIKDVTRAVENAGVLVLVCNFGTDLLDGLSLRVEGLPPLIFLRADMSGDRYRFTLAHELGHLIMHWFNPTADDLMEKQADRFAGAFLMPAHDIGPQLHGLTLSKLVMLKQVWGLSMQAILYRAKDLGEVNERQSEALWRQISRAGYRKTEPVDVPRERPTLLTEVVELHLDDLGYDVEDVSRMLHLNVAEFVRLYLQGSSKLRAVPTLGSGGTDGSERRSRPWPRAV